VLRLKKWSQAAYLSHKRHKRHKNIHYLFCAFCAFLWLELTEHVEAFKNRA